MYFGTTYILSREIQVEKKIVINFMCKNRTTHTIKRKLNKHQLNIIFSIHFSV